jgi:fumarate reductase (CoM/CoB) subunit A
MDYYQFIKTDVLVIGSGGAGLRAAIEAREQGCDVLLVSKSALGRGNNTAVAGGAMAAATGWPDPKDHPKVHFDDTLAAGRFINDHRLVKILVHGAEQQVHDLERFGVEFAKEGEKYLTLNIPHHTCPRVIKARQGIGTGYTLPLLKYALKIGVRTMEKIFIRSLFQNDGTVVGAMGIDLKNNTFVFHSKSVILASGGLGQLFSRTSNSAGAAGDGYILAYDAGARLKDMEFIQFLPATLITNSKRLFLYEAFVESGALFKNSIGEDIALRHGISDPKEMTRDKVARAVMLEILEGRGIDGAVFLDFSPISEF